MAGSARPTLKTLVAQAFQPVPAQAKACGYQNWLLATEY
jgi:hypothetical protein